MRALAVLLIVGVTALAPLAARAADITSANATIKDGRLIITGAAAVPGMRIRLDGKTSADFNTVAGGAQTGALFSFKVLYLPSDCVITLQKVTGTTLGPPSNWPVTHCGTASVFPRGAWNAALPYLKNDLVTFQGSSWLALRANTASLPAARTNWVLFASKGATGPEGPQGPPGQDGAFARERLVTKVCDDNGGWTPDAGTVYCIVSCPVGEIGSRSNKIAELRSTGFSDMFGTVPTFDPAIAPPFPRNKWFAASADSNDGNGRAVVSRQHIARIICEAP